MTDAEPGEAGFMDRENKLGAEWSPELMDCAESDAAFSCRSIPGVISERLLR